MTTGSITGSGVTGSTTGSGSGITGSTTGSVTGSSTIIGALH